MAFRGIIDNRRADAENFAAMQRGISSGLSEVLDTLAEIKALKGRQLMEQNVREAMSRGPQAEWGGMDQSMATPADTLEARMARVNEAITGTRAKARPKDFLSGLLSAFNPNVPTFLETTPVEELVTRGATGEMFRDPMDAEYRRQQIESAKALIKEREERTRMRIAAAKGKDPSIEIARLQGIMENALPGSELERVTQSRIDQLTEQWGISSPPEPVDAVTMASPSIQSPEITVAATAPAARSPARSSLWDRAGALASRIPSGVSMGGVTRPAGIAATQGIQPAETVTQIANDEEYDALPPGTAFIGPDGVKRRKP